MIRYFLHLPGGVRLLCKAVQTNATWVSFYPLKRLTTEQREMVHEHGGNKTGDKWWQLPAPLVLSIIPTTEQS